jgi:hypothetical protein
MPLSSFPIGLCLGLALFLGCKSSSDDTHYSVMPDGRRIEIVDYCLPILPLQSGSAMCPANLAEAQAIVDVIQDGGALDAAMRLFNSRIRPCVEPIAVFIPIEWASSTVCFYDNTSGDLISITQGWDTPTGCPSEPRPDTAAFIAKVYGQKVECTRP